MVQFHLEVDGRRYVSDRSGNYMCVGRAVDPAVREALINFYKEVDATKVGNVDVLLQSHDIETLKQALFKKYKRNPFNNIKKAKAPAPAPRQRRQTPPCP